MIEAEVFGGQQISGEIDLPKEVIEAQSLRRFVKKINAGGAVNDEGKKLVVGEPVNRRVNGTREYSVELRSPSNEKNQIIVYRRKYQIERHPKPKAGKEKEAFKKVGLIINEGLDHTDKLLKIVGKKMPNAKTVALHRASTPGKF